MLSACEIEPETAPAVLAGAALPEPEHLFNRPPRITRRLPQDEIVIPAPPSTTTSGAPLPLPMVLLPIITALVYGGAMLARRAPGASVWSSVPLVATGLLGGSFGVYNYFYQRRRRARQQAAQGETYAAALEALRSRLEHFDRRQREMREANDPAIDQLPKLAAGAEPWRSAPQPAARLWERRPADADFLQLRVGRGTVPTSLTIKPPAENLLQFTPELRRAVALAAEFALVKDVPLTVSLLRHGSLGIAGPAGAVLAHTRALLWQIAVHHSPKEVRIAAFWDARHDAEWEWLRWLPHTRPLDGDDSYRLLARFDGPAEPLQQVLGVLAGALQQRREQPTAAESRPHLVVVVGDYALHALAIQPFAPALNAGGALGCTLLCLVDDARAVPGECGAYIDLAYEPTLAIAGADGGTQSFVPDTATAEASSRIARSLAPIVQAESDGQREMPRSVRLLPLLGIDDARTYQPWRLWSRLPADSWHAIPLGLQDAATALELNLNEGFDGVHGMIAGTTGSGKSEFLLTLLLALAIKHGPDRVNFMLIDFKGGATFQSLDRLPHTAGVVTDLQGNMAERALVAINSELDRRKQRLAAARSSARSDVANIRAYRKHGFEAHPAFGPMPNLLIAIDEFDEMLRDYPEFVAELVRVAKQGRSLGVHLLFATQQPSLIKDGLTRNLTYWLALRVTSPDDSKMMIGIPDAAYLTTETPGRGYLRVGKQVLSFQSARVTTPYQRPVSGSRLGLVDVTGRTQPLAGHDRALQELRTILAAERGVGGGPDAASAARMAASFLAAYGRLARAQRLPDVELAHIAEDATHAAVSELIVQHPAADADALLEQLLSLLHARQVVEPELALIAAAMLADPATGAGYAARRYPIWTEPLRAELALADVVDTASGSAARWLSAPLGLLDLPSEARQQPFVLDLAEQHGNLLILGSARSGKTTCVRSLIMSLALRHSPAELWIYLIDPSGFGCGFLAPAPAADGDALIPQLPHIADAFTPQHAPKLERLLIELGEHIRRRLALLQAHAVDSLAQLYAATAQQPTLLPPAILVVVENVAELATSQPEAFETLKILLRDARKCGVAFVVTGYGWRDVASIQSSFETRIALRLNDATDSDALIGKAYAARIAADQPGRAFLRTAERPLELQVALPLLRDPRAAQQAPQEFGESLRMIARRHAAVVAGRPQPLRALPARVALAELRAPDAPEPGFGTAIALDGMTLRPIVLDFAATTPHLLIAGGPRSGKSELLRTILAGLAERYGPEEAQFALVDYRRRSLRPFAALPHARSIVLPGGGSAHAEQPPITLATSEAEVRALVADLAAEMARRAARGTCSPRIVLAISNWDLLAETAPSWKPLGQWIIQGRDLGLHLVVTGAEFNSFTSTEMLKLARLERCAAFLGTPAETSSVPSTLGLKLPRHAAQRDMPPGRGFLALGGPAQLVQFAIWDAAAA